MINLAVLPENCDVPGLHFGFVYLNVIVVIQYLLDVGRSMNPGSSGSKCEAVTVKRVAGTDLVSMYGGLKVALHLLNLKARASQRWLSIHFIAYVP